MNFSKQACGLNNQACCVRLIFYFNSYVLSPISSILMLFILCTKIFCKFNIHTQIFLYLLLNKRGARKAVVNKIVKKLINTRDQLLSAITRE